ncbi:MAG: AbrB/MazE/SpoVT family DNA-binding domain-containing protein [Alphaproteobacteria bacterium]|nr:AbrB/MazE/SpoVT family DNA-binding domain-containing protein [Alphaproteobacteria bacterium]
MLAIAKWGNSLALRLPRHLAEGAGLKEGTPVKCEISGGTIVIKADRPKYRLDDLLKGHQKKHRRRETDWGASQGAET